SLVPRSSSPRDHSPQHLRRPLAAIAGGFRGGRWGGVARPRGTRSLPLRGWAPSGRRAPDDTLRERVSSTPPHGPPRKPPTPPKAADPQCRAARRIADEIEDQPTSFAPVNTDAGGGLGWRVRGCVGVEKDPFP